MDMIVTAVNGDPVRVRKEPSTASETVARIRCGETVRVGDEVNGWRPVTYKDTKGYMMEKFLKREDSYKKSLTATDLNRLCDARDKLESALRTIKDVVGVR